MNYISFPGIFCLALITFNIAFAEGIEKVCPIVSFTYGELTMWALKSENSLECTQIAIGGHSSLELLPQRLLLFDDPYRLLTAGEDVQEILDKKRINTFFNAKARKLRSLPVVKGSFDCRYKGVLSSTALNNTVTPPLQGTTYSTSQLASSQQVTSSRSIEATTPVVTGISEGTNYSTSQLASSQQGTSSRSIEATTPVVTGISEGTNYSTSQLASSQQGTSSRSIEATTPVVTGISGGTNYSTSQLASSQQGTSSRSTEATTPVVTGISEGTTYSTSQLASRQQGTSSRSIEATTPVVTGISEGTTYSTSQLASSQRGTSSRSIEATTPVVTGISEGTTYSTSQLASSQQGTSSRSIQATTPVVTGISEDLIIESSSVFLVDPDGIKENTANQFITLNITLQVAQNSPDFDLQRNFWKGVRFYTTDTERMQSGNVSNTTFLIFDEPRTNVTFSSDPCGSIQCHNGGTCINLSSYGMPNQCMCPSNFFGDTCSYEAHPCDPNPCMNGGSCIVQDGGIGFKCECSLSFKGEWCQEFSRFCSELQCDNGGTCYEIHGLLAFCSCPNNSTGPTCASRALSNRHPAIKQTVVYSNFDTVASSCRDIPPLFCVTMEVNPSFSVTFLNNSQTACSPLTCRGVEILEMNLEHHDLVVTERIPLYNLSVNISVKSDASGASISGKSLWKLVAFFDTQTNCRGNAYPETLTQNLRAMDMSLAAGETLVLTSVLFSNMSLLNLVCPNGPLYLCVELDKHPNATPPFTLQFSGGNNTTNFSPPNVCLKSTCRGVEILEVKLESPDLEIMERDPSYNLSVNISVESDVGGASISGTSLWKLDAFVDTRQDCSSNSFPESLTQSLQVDNTSLVAGVTLNISHFLTVDLSSLVCPDGHLYLCIKFSKHPSANPPFTLNFSPEHTSNYASVEATCRGVVISENNISIIGPEIISNREDTVFSFNVKLGFAQHSGSIFGTSLWEITAFVNQSMNGQSEMESGEALAHLTIAQRNMSAMPGELVEFDNLGTTLSTTNFECSLGVAYLCVNVKSSSDSVPRFSLSGQVIGCTPVQCKGMIVESSFAFLKSPDAILENTAEQSITIFMNLTVTYTNSSPFVFPQIRWNIAKVYGVDGEGRHIENLTLSDIRLTQEPLVNTELVVTTSFHTVGFACQNISKLICVTLESDPRFFVTFRRNSQTVCAPLPCKGVEVTLSTLSFKSPVLVKEGSICNYFNLDFFVTFGNTSATVSGTNLWELVIFGSKDVEGFGNHKFHTTISINNPSLRNQDAINSTKISFTQQQVTVDLTGVKCADFSYVCVKINRDGLSNPTFTLTGEPESARIACQNLTCIEQDVMPCNSNQQLFDCFCIQNNTSGSVKFGNLSQCYCYTSSGGKCLWLPHDCSQLYEGGVNQDGVYTIHTTRCPQLSFNVYCDMTNNGGGWTVFQRRTYRSSLAFNRNWSEYEDGFGNFEDNFWLGNDKLCHFTQQQRYKLRVDTSHSSSIYQIFTMGCANVDYTLLSTGSFSKETDYALDGLSTYTNMEFNTCDRRGDCECGWWCCPDCDKATNLNLGEDNGQITWGHVPVESSEMKIKPFNK